MKLKYLFLCTVVTIFTASCGGSSNSTNDVGEGATSGAEGMTDFSADDTADSDAVDTTDTGVDSVVETGTDSTEDTGGINGTADTGVDGTIDSGATVPDADFGFMVTVGIGINSALQLDGASLCFVANSDTQITLERFLTDINITYELVSSSTSVAVPPEYTAGRCDAVLGTLAILETIITSTDEPNENQIVRLTIADAESAIESEGSGVSGEPADTSDEGNTPRLTGIFVDSEVQGLSYNTLSTSGITTAAGEFSYLEGESVTFSVGALQLPQAIAAPQLSPIDLAIGKPYNVATATNIARMLQSLDVDGNPENGIEINASAASSATAINFSVSIDDFENNSEVINLVANSGSTTTSLIGVQAALLHMNETLGITFNQGNIEAGEGAASTCVACHGTTSDSFSVFGSLAGLSPLYITAILQAYNARAIAGIDEEQGLDTVIMVPIAANLTEQDILDLAAYYASLD